MARCLLSSLRQAYAPFYEKSRKTGGLYDVIEATHSYEGLQAADVALPEGVTLDIRYLIVW
jgi:hypothetical protein